MSAFPEDWQSTDPSALPGPTASTGPAADLPAMAPTRPSTRRSRPARASTPAAVASAKAPEPANEGPTPAEPVEPAWALPAPVLQALTDGGAVVVPEGDTGVVTIRMSGMPLLRIEPHARPAVAWCSEMFGVALAGLCQVERWTKALAANRQADLLLHQGLRAELEVRPILHGLGRGGFRATQGGGIRVTEYRLSHPALGDVATLHVARHALHVGEVTWPSPKVKAMVRAMLAIEAAGRKA